MQHQHKTWPRFSLALYLCFLGGTCLGGEVAEGFMSSHRRSCSRGNVNGASSLSSLKCQLIISTYLKPIFPPASGSPLSTFEWFTTFEGRASISAVFLGYLVECGASVSMSVGGPRPRLQHRPRNPFKVTSFVVFKAIMSLYPVLMWQNIDKYNKYWKGNLGRVDIKPWLFFNILKYYLF